MDGRSFIKEIEHFLTRLSSFRLNQVIKEDTPLYSINCELLSNPSIPHEAISWALVHEEEMPLRHQRKNETDAITEDTDAGQEAFLSFKDIFRVVPFVSHDGDDDNDHANEGGGGGPGRGFNVVDKGKRKVVVQKDLIGTRIQLTLDRKFFKRRQRRHQWFQISVKANGKTLSRKSLLQVKGSG